MDFRAYLYTNQICRQCIPNALVVGTPENGERSDFRLAVSPCKRFDGMGGQTVAITCRKNLGGRRRAPLLSGQIFGLAFHQIALQGDKMNYDEITKITAERISDYMTEAVNTDSKVVAEMFHNAAWGVRALWFELVTKIDMDIHKKNRYASYDLRRKIEMQHEEFQKMTAREQVPLLKSPE